MAVDTQRLDVAPVRRRPRGVVLAVLAVLVAIALAGHRLIPPLGGLAFLWESFLPWTAVAIGLLILLGLLRRSVLAVAVALVPAVIWSLMFVPQLLPKDVAGPANLLVASQNIGADNVDAASAAQALIDSRAAVVSVQEISGSAGRRAVALLDAAYPHHAMVGTVGLWSTYPIARAARLELGLSWARGMRATVSVPNRELTVYAVHLPSVRPGQQDRRDAGVNRLAELVRDDGTARILLMGDLNTASTDRRFSRLTDLLTDSRQAVGGGFGFTWTSTLPMTRLDHVMVHGPSVVSDRVLAGNGSDHRAVLVGLRL